MGLNLRDAVVDDNLSKVKFLIFFGANVNSVTVLGETPLHFAAEFGRVEIAKVLLAKGANVDATGLLGRTPLHFASLSGNIKIFKVLLAKGANVNIADSEQNTPLHMAARYSNQEAVKLLLTRGSDVNAVNHAGRTPLHEAAENGTAEEVRILVECGANINAIDEKGSTAIQLAADNNKTETVDFLSKCKGIIVHFNLAKDKAPPLDEAYYYNRGLMKQESKDFKGAYEDFTEAINKNPKNSKIYNNRGITKSKIHDYKEAIENYNKAIKLNPNESIYYYNRGLAWYHLNAPENAIPDFNKAIELNPNYTNVYYNRGRAKEALNDFSGALADYKLMLKVQPRHSGAAQKIEYYNKPVVEFENEVKRENDAYLKLVNESSPNANKVTPLQTESFKDQKGKEKNASIGTPIENINADNLNQTLISNDINDDTDNDEALKSIISRIKDHFTKNVKWTYRNNLDEYVKPDVGFQSEAKQRMDAEKMLDDFIKDPKKLSLLLIGDRGFGKSFVSQSLAKDYWNYWQSWLENKSANLPQNWLPIWIRLPSIRNNEDRHSAILESYLFNELNLDRNKIDILESACEKGKCCLLVILDGIDEVSLLNDIGEISLAENNLYLANDWWSDINWPNLKVVATCRPEALLTEKGEVDWKRMFYLSPGNAASFTEVWLQSFNENQIDLYLQTQAKLFDTNHCGEKITLNWADWNTYKHYLTTIRPLAELAKNPFLLNAITRTLPEVIKQENYTANEMIEVRKEIYDKVIDIWFDAQVDRFLQDKNKEVQLLIASNAEKVKKIGSEHEFLKQCLVRYSKNLAFLAHKTGTGKDHVLSNDLTLNPILFDPNFNEKSYFQLPADASIMEIIRSGCLLREQGDGYRFLDNSILEYFSHNPSPEDPLIQQATKSAFNAKLVVDYNNWIVTLARNPTSENGANHAYIIVEGMDSNGHMLLRRYEITIKEKDGSNVTPGYARVSILDKAGVSIQDHREKLSELLLCSPDRVYGKRPWKITREEAESLHNDIKKEEGQLVPFIAVSNQFLVIKGKHNCYTWAREKLTNLGKTHINQDLAVKRKDYLGVFPNFHLDKMPDEKYDHTIENLRKMSFS